MLEQPRVAADAERRRERPHQSAAPREHRGAPRRHERQSGHGLERDQGDAGRALNGDAAAGDEPRQRVQRRVNLGRPRRQRHEPCAGPAGAKDVADRPARALQAVDRARRARGFRRRRGGVAAADGAVCALERGDGVGEQRGEPCRSQSGRSSGRVAPRAASAAAEGVLGLRRHCCAVEVFGSGGSGRSAAAAAAAAAAPAAAAAA